MKLRVATAGLLATFLVLWLVSFDQYLFVPILAIVSYLASGHGPQAPALKAPVVLTLALAGMAFLGLVAVGFTDYLSNASRTVDVYASTLLLVIAACSGGRRSTSLIVRVLLGIWILSLVVYAVGQFAPTLTNALLAAKTSTGPASSTGFWDETTMFGIQSTRPVGFALYANEFALFGLVVAPLYIWHERPRSRFLAAALILLSLVGVVLSTGRSLMLATAIALAILMAVRPSLHTRNPRLSLTMTTALLVAVGISVALVVPDLGAVLRGELDTVSNARIGASQELRETAYQAGLELARDHFVSGVGGLPEIGGVIQAGSHDLLLSAIVRHGVPGLVLMVALLASVLVVALRALVQPTLSSGLVGMSLLVAFVVSVTIQFDDDVLTFATVVLATALMTAELNAGREKDRVADGRYDQASVEDAASTR